MKCKNLINRKTLSSDVAWLFYIMMPGQLCVTAVNIMDGDTGWQVPKDGSGPSQTGFNWASWCNWKGWRVFAGAQVRCYLPSYTRSFGDTNYLSKSFAEIVLS